MAATNACPMTGPQDVDLLDANVFAAAQDPQMFRVLHDPDPLFWNRGPGDEPGFWSLTRYADVESVAKDADRFCSGEGTRIPSRRAEGPGPRQIHNMDSPDHAPMRRLLTGTFSPRAVEKLAGEGRGGRHRAAR